MPEVGNAILRAGLKRGWAMYEETPGHIVATLDVRSHHVSVDIKYDQQNYSLNYNESRNMNHDGANIHPKYNEWISRLNRAIQAELVGLHHTYLPPPAAGA